VVSESRTQQPPRTAPVGSVPGMDSRPSAARRSPRSVSPSSSARPGC